MARHRPSTGARRIGRLRERSPTATLTGAPGTWELRQPEPTRLPPPRLSRRGCARASGVRTPYRARRLRRAARLAADGERQARLLAAAAETLWLAGFADRAIVLLQESRALAVETDLLVQIDRLRGQIAARRGPVMEGYAILVAAADRVAAAAPDLAIGLLADAVDAGFYAGDVAAMLESARRMTGLLSPASSTRSRFLAAAATGMALVFTRDAHLGIESIRTAMTLLDQDEGLRRDTDLLPWIVIVPLFLRESGSARSLVDEAIETARTRAALGILPWLLNRVARDHAAADGWGQATVEYDEAVRLAHETGQRTELSAALAGWAWLEARQGREADCRAHATEALTLCAELGTHLFEIWATRALGELELGLGRASAAIGHLEDCNARLEAQGIQDVDLVPNAELIDAYLRVGRRADAERLVHELDVEASRKGQPWSLARAARSRGLVATEDEFRAPLRQRRETARANARCVRAWHHAACVWRPASTSAPTDAGAQRAPHGARDF